MFFPTTDDNVGILVNCLLYLLIVICFDALLLVQFKLSTVPDKFGSTSIPFYMNV